MASLNYILLGMVACTFFMQGEAIKCYQCSDKTACNDDPNTGSTDVQEITAIGNSDCKYCTKMKTIRSDGYHSVNRGCLTDNDYTELTETKANEDACIACEDHDNCGYEKITCICNSDNCNHGNNILPSVVTMLVMLGLMKFIC